MSPRSARSTNLEQAVTSVIPIPEGEAVPSMLFAESRATFGGIGDNARITVSISNLLAPL